MEAGAESGSRERTPLPVSGPPGWGARLLPGGDLGWLWAIVVAAIVRIPHLGTVSLGVDDGVSLFNAAPPLSEIMSAMLAGREVHPPLYFYWLHPFVSAAGPTAFRLAGGMEAWFRWSSIPWSLAVVALTYSVAAHLGGRRVAFLASLLVASSAFLAYYSWEVRMYPMQTALVLASAFAFLQAESGGRRGALWLVGLVGLSLLAFFTHYLSIFHLAPLGLALAARAWRERAGRGRRIAALVGVLVPVAAWGHVMLGQAGSQPMFLRDAPGWPQLVELTFQCFFGVTWNVPLAGWPELASAGWSVAPAKWVGMLAGMAALAGLASASPRARWMVAGQVLAPLAGVLVVTTFTSVRVFEYKYFQSVVPWLFVAVAHLGTEPGGVLRRGVGLVGGLLIAANLWACMTWHSAPAFWGPQPWRPVLEAVEPRMEAGDQILVHPSMMMAPVLAYGFFEARLRPCVFDSGARGGGASLRVTGVDTPSDTQLGEALARSGRVWLLLTPHHPWVVRQHLESVLLQRWEARAAWETDGFWPANRIRVVLLVPRREGVGGAPQGPPRRRGERIGGGPETSGGGKAL